jgi:hypothetical protein
MIETKEVFMSVTIDQAFIDQFRANVYMHLSQQTETRLWQFCRQETQNGESQFFDRIGKAAGQKIVDRHGDTPNNNTEHSRRMVTLTGYDVADLTDDEDQIRMLINPNSEYVKAHAAFLKRMRDLEVITAALGNAYGGQKGQTAIALPSTQKLVSTKEDASDTVGTGLTLHTLRKIKKKIWQKEAEGKIYMAVNAEALEDLLEDPKVQSADYNTVKALVQGDVDEYMGIKFLRTEQLPVTAAATTYTPGTGLVGAGGGTLAAGARRLFAWVEGGIVASTGKQDSFDIGPRRDKRNSIQVYSKANFGAGRMEEERVVEVDIKE